MGVITKTKSVIKKLFGKNISEIDYLKARGLTLGNRVDVFSEHCFDSIYPGLITVGDYVTISSNVKILAHDASMGYVCSGACKIGTVTIGNHCFIGHGSTILCNTRIGDNVIIGAGSVVSGDIPSGCVYAGNPARFIKSTDEFMNQHNANMETHPTFSIPWQNFKYFDPADWDSIRHELRDTYGYVVRK